MKKQTKKIKAIVYIDGYNLYYGLRVAYKGKYKWLDLQALASSFIQSNMEIVTIKYFTAITKNDNETKNRQELFLKALKSHCDKLEIFYSRFLSKSRQCRSCATQYKYYEEKKTGVNIACQMLNDAHLDNYDCCYIISGEGDLVPPVKIIKQSFLGKKVIIANPPKRKSDELCKVAGSFFTISEKKIRTSQLPDVVISANNTKLIKPKQWRN